MWGWGATGAVRFIVLCFLCMIRMTQLQKIVSCQVPCSPAGVREIPSTGIARSPGITNPLRLASTGSGKATVRDLPLTAGFCFAYFFFLYLLVMKGIYQSHYWTYFPIFSRDLGKWMAEKRSNRFETVHSPSDSGLPMWCFSKWGWLQTEVPLLLL